MINPLTFLKSVSESLTPTFRIILKDTDSDITQHISDRLISLTLNDNRGFEVDQLDITLDDVDGKLQLPRRGVTLSLYLGWKGQTLIDKGDFIIDEVSYSGSPDIITLRGRSADFKSSMNVRCEKSFHNMTLKAIIKSIAEKNKLSCVISEQFSNITIKHIDQTESDCSFLTRLATEHNATATIKKNKLLFFKTGQAISASGLPLQLLTITRSIGDNYYYSLADRDNYNVVKANYLNTATKKTGSVTVGNEENNDNDNNVFILRHQYASKENAHRAAKAKYAQLKRGQSEFSIKLAMARPDLFPEIPVKVNGFKEQIDNEDWLIKVVKHELNDSGFTSSIELESRLDYSQNENKL